ncbi:DUF4202 domain-containing protein [Maribacter ulvicola]|uniref:DUF4202 domain-containing protein n=1 Tax=Maribacter ulvicola TaxID=228959 RepID=A0A1N6PBQ1_9FLAO|nr:DUF4202 domain-containing protein [Maribacter ulvicola]SIQ01828.1 protein of unknown function [Maribacter ulvicola]
MVTTPKLLIAFQRFDDANQKDPNTEVFQGNTYPKEVLYGIRMSERLNSFDLEASEALQLTARCQHICRWEIPRDAYEMNRAGYLRWRQELKKFHVSKASEILEEVGYDKKTIEKVKFLLQKKQLKKNEETQVLEDVICLVFLEFYFEPFAQKHPEAKTLDILQKTWVKMSLQGQEAALKLPLSKFSKDLINKALNS